MSNDNQEMYNIKRSTFNKYPTNYQSNLFTESRQEFTEMEKKIVTLVVNQIGHMALKNEIESKMNVVLQVPFLELSRARYDQVATAAESLSKKRLSFRNDKNGDFTFMTPFPLVQSAVVNGIKVIEITLLANVVPYFAELGQRYTKYDIDVMLSLSSTYAQRMFEIVSMFYHRSQYQFKYEVDELRVILNCPETYRYNDFCLYALNVAQRELANKAGLNITWIPSKKVGKKVVELEFTIKTSKELAVDAVEKERRQVNKMSINEAVSTAWQLMKAYKLKDWQKDLIASDPELLGTFLRVDSELGNGLRTNIKNPTAYLIKSLGIDQMKAPAKVKKTPRKTALEQLPLPIIAQGPEVRLGKDAKLTDILEGMFGK